MRPYAFLVLNWCFWEQKPLAPGVLELYRYGFLFVIWAYISPVCIIRDNIAESFVFQFNFRSIFRGKKRKSDKDEDKKPTRIDLGGG